MNNLLLVAKPTYSIPTQVTVDHSKPGRFPHLKFVAHRVKFETLPPPAYAHSAMNNSVAIRISAVMGFLAVALGAFGAHGLKNLLTENATVAIWEKAVLYHFIHAIMLFILAGRRPVQSIPWLCFFAGILIFSGSLYLLAVTNMRWLGAITPIGGVSLLLGWLWLVFNPQVGER